MDWCQADCVSARSNKQTITRVSFETAGFLFLLVIVLIKTGALDFGTSQYAEAGRRCPGWATSTPPRQHDKESHALDDHQIRIDRRRRRAGH